MDIVVTIPRKEYINDDLETEYFKKWLCFIINSVLKHSLIFLKNIVKKFRKSVDIYFN